MLRELTTHVLLSWLPSFHGFQRLTRTLPWWPSGIYEHPFCKCKRLFTHVLSLSRKVSFKKNFKQHLISISLTRSCKINFLLTLRIELTLSLNESAHPLYKGYCEWPSISRMRLLLCKHCFFFNFGDCFTIWRIYSSSKWLFKWVNTFVKNFYALTRNSVLAKFCSVDWDATNKRNDWKTKHCKE